MSNELIPPEEVAKEVLEIGNRALEDAGITDERQIQKFWQKIAFLVGYNSQMPK